MWPRNLEQLQRRFWCCITAPEGVAAAVPVLTRTDPDAALERWLAAPPRGSAAERLDLYANMYFYRLLGVLREDYPKLFAVVGDAHFHNLITDYLLVHPSRDPSISNVGQVLPQFVVTHPLSERWPFLGDLARLERARTEVFDAAEAAPLGAAELAQVPPEGWGALRFALVPSARVVELGFPVDAVWLALERGAPLPHVTPASTAVLVFRREHRVYHRALAPDEAEALVALTAGEPFAAICERLAARHGDETAAGLALGVVVRATTDAFLDVRV